MAVMSAETIPDLLPCPFCGASGDRLETSARHFREGVSGAIFQRHWKVYCTRCGCERDSIAAWNRRAARSAQPVVRLKPLIWDKLGIKAPSIVGQYTVHVRDTGVWWSLAEIASSRRYENDAQARDAAQADYEHRIISALLPPDHTALLREAMTALEMPRDIREGNPMLDNEPPMFVTGYECACRDIADLQRPALQSLKAALGDTR
jgi:hypothetical protein